MTRDLNTVGIVLAGGLARRMGGGDKALRVFDGRALLDHALDRVAPQLRAIALNANGDPSRFAAWHLPVIADPVPDHPGPLAGVLAGMRWAQAHFPDVADLLSVPTDTPFLPTDLVARLRAGRGGKAIAVATSAGQSHPVVALWPVALADALEAGLRGGARRIDVWTAEHGVAAVEFSTENGDPFFNINRPEDLDHRSLADLDHRK